jgi:hypothetical protein
MERLAFIYQVIIASEPMLRDAIYLLSDDGWEGDLKSFYERHLEDELNHAAWAKEDLGGYPVNLHFGAAQMAGMAYYLIRHVHPVALMGYMMALEGEPIDMAYVEAIEREHGKAAARMLRHHAEEDPKHFQELLSVHIPAEWTPLVESTRKQTLMLLHSTAC